MKMILLEKRGRMLAGVNATHIVLAVGHNTMATWFKYPDVNQMFIAVYSARDSYEMDNVSGLDDAQAVFYYLTGELKYTKQWTGILVMIRQLRL